MRAVVHDRYGPPSVLRIAEVEQPTPAPDEVLVRVHATTVNRTDCGFREPRPAFVRLFSGLLRPRRRVLGTEFAGIVEQVGSSVGSFTVGDRVFGVNAGRFGAWAEYLCVGQDRPVARMPEAMSFAEAAAVCDGAILAMSCLRPARLHKGDRLLVYGASGSIGSAAVQLAKAAGVEVTAVCGPSAVDTLRRLGADDVLDYTKEDFAAAEGRYDAVFDAVGKTSFRRCRRLLKPRGYYLETDLGFLGQNPGLALLTRCLPARQVRMPIPRYTRANVLVLKEQIEAGTYRAVIDRTYPLERVVEATTYVESGQKIGNVVLTVTGPAA
jgi:NADPH:quinone reductase-like Zn-dependent oxidoreductase